MGSRISIRPGIEEGEPCLCEGAPRAAVSSSRVRFDRRPSVVSVVSKKYTGADFVFADSNSDSFTVTKSSVISSVTTGIYKRNGELARADKRSAVIYKIVKKTEL